MIAKNRICDVKKLGFIVKRRLILTHLAYITVANHVTNDVCFIPIMGAAILKFLPARRRFSRFYDTEEHLLEDKRTSEVSKQHRLSLSLIF